MSDPTEPFPQIPGSDPWSQPQPPPPPPGTPQAPPPPSGPGQSVHGQDPGYGQSVLGQDPGYGQSVYGRQPGYGWPPPSGGASTPARVNRQIDLPKLVMIGAWVVLGLHVLAYLYGLIEGGPGSDAGDRFFLGMPLLGQGILYCGVLHAVAVWLGRQQREDA